MCFSAWSGDVAAGVGSVGKKLVKGNEASWFTAGRPSGQHVILPHIWPPAGGISIRVAASSWATKSDGAWKITKKEWIRLENMSGSTFNEFLHHHHCRSFSRRTSHIHNIFPVKGISYEMGHDRLFLSFFTASSNLDTESKWNHPFQNHSVLNKTWD